MKKIIGLSFFLFSVISYSQINSVDYELNMKNIDSIQFSIWNIHTKEMSTPNNIKEYKKKLKQVALKSIDQELFIKTILDTKSYDGSLALLYHNNLLFQIYSKGLITTEIGISTITGNIYIENKINKSYFRNNCSKKGGKYFISLLKSYDLLSFIDEYELEGLK